MNLTYHASRHAAPDGGAVQHTRHVQVIYVAGISREFAAHFFPEHGPANNPVRHTLM